MELFDLGEVPWEQTQLLYHALPRLGRPAAVLCWPDRPYVCLGFSQDAGEVDLDFCRRQGLPVFRRAVGGGLVYLDREQVFFHLVLPRGARGPVEAIFARCLEPVVRTLRGLGLPAAIRRPCDVVVRGRKISGNGGGEVNGHPVVVGNVLLDFDYETMARVLSAPDEGFRSLFLGLMRERLTTLRREAPGVGREEVRARLRRELESAFGPFAPGRLDGALLREMEAVRQEMADLDWPDWQRPPQPVRAVKVAEGCWVRHARVGGRSVTWCEEDAEAVR